MLQQEIAFNIQQTDALTRLVIAVDDKDMWGWASHWSLNWDTFGVITVLAAVALSSLSSYLLSLSSFPSSIEI